MIIMIIFGAILFVAGAIIFAQYIKSRIVYKLEAKYEAELDNFKNTHQDEYNSFVAWKLNKEDREEYDRLTLLHSKYEKCYTNKTILAFCVCACILCSLALLVCGGFAILMKVNTNNNKAYDTYNAQYYVLEYRIKEEDKALTNIELYKAITEYNNSVISAQKACQNPFINIFQDQSVMGCKVFDTRKFMEESND